MSGISTQNRMLILGSSGFVGKSFISLLSSDFKKRAAFDEIILTFRSSATVDYPWVKNLRFDFRNATDTFPETEIIFHAATPASAELNSFNPDLMYDLNVSAMRKVLDTVRSWRIPPRILFTSSGAVYGEMPIGVQSFVEERQWSIDNQLGLSAYAEGKRVAESMLRVASEEGTCVGVIARMFAFSGEHLPRDRHFAIGNFVESAVTNRQIRVRSDGSAIRSYLDERDMAQWLLQIAQNGTSSKIYHVGSERAISIRELAYLVAERYGSLTGDHIPVEILGRSSPLDGVSRYVPSTVRTREELGLSETISLERSIDDMLQAAITQQS